MVDSREIVVVGLGTAGGVPDRCVITLALNVAADTSGTALAEVTKLASKVVGVLQARGIAASDAQTSHLALQEFHDSEKKRVTGRVASYGLTVLVGGLAEAGPLLTELAEVAGDSLQVRGLQLQMSDPKPLVDAARRAAVADALERARQLADAAGLRLGGISSIEEGSGAPGESFRRLTARAATDSGMPVEAGTSSVTVHVTVRIAIAD